MMHVRAALPVGKVGEPRNLASLARGHNFGVTGSIQ